MAVGPNFTVGETIWRFENNNILVNERAPQELGLIITVYLCVSKRHDATDVGKGFNISTNLRVELVQRG
jgi:hypothetical protein